MAGWKAAWERGGGSEQEEQGGDRVMDYEVYTKATATEQEWGLSHRIQTALCCLRRIITFVRNTHQRTGPFYRERRAWLVKNHLTQGTHAAEIALSHRLIQTWAGTCDSISRMPVRYASSGPFLRQSQEGWNFGLGHAVSPLIFIKHRPYIRKRG